MKRFFSLFILVAAAFAAVSCDQPQPDVEKAPIVIYDGPVAYPTRAERGLRRGTKTTVVIYCGNHV